MSRLSSRLGLALVAAMLLVGSWSSTATATAAGTGYIVVLQHSVSDPGAVAAEHAARFDLEIGYVYRHAVEGYSAVVPAGAVSALREDPRVAYVELDGLVIASATQTGATWGLDRIDQRNRPLSGTYTYTATGSGVTAYVIDTGIRRSHTEFGGRAVRGFDSVDGGLVEDCNGHGTHVAGTIGGATYGVAKAVRLVSVRVLNCLGTGATSGVIAGVDWVTADHAAGAPAVANMSLGGGASSALDTAVRNSIADGVSYAIAAGNGDSLGVAQNACNTSPARVPEAMTISATDSSDRKASWANFGNCVDWFAPGVSITSAWWTTDTATDTISGTSMATPHTAGVAAQYLQTSPAATPAAVASALRTKTTKNVVTSPGSGSPNALLFTDL